MFTQVTRVVPFCFQSDSCELPSYLRGSILEPQFLLILACRERTLNTIKVEPCNLFVLSQPLRHPDRIGGFCDGLQPTSDGRIKSMFFSFLFVKPSRPRTPSARAFTGRPRQELHGPDVEKTRRSRRRLKRFRRTHARG